MNTCKWKNKKFISGLILLGACTISMLIAGLYSYNKSKDQELQYMVLPILQETDIMLDQISDLFQKVSYEGKNYTKEDCRAIYVIASKMVDLNDQLVAMLYKDIDEEDNVYTITKLQNELEKIQIDLQHLYDNYESYHPINAEYSLNQYKVFFEAYKRQVILCMEHIEKEDFEWRESYIDLQRLTVKTSLLV